jgi:hypothetical protein
MGLHRSNPQGKLCPPIWLQEGVPVKLAEDVIFARAKQYAPKGSNEQPRHLGYFKEAVKEAWSRDKHSETQVNIRSAASSPQLGSKLLRIRKANLSKGLQC